MTDNSRIHKIRALLAKAENAVTPPQEAELLRAKAIELMAKYGIEQALIADTDTGSDPLADRKIDLPNPWGMERARLMNCLANALGCQQVRLPGEAQGGQRVHLFGYESDLQRLEMLYTSLLLQMLNGAKRIIPPTGSAPRAYRRSWMGGFTARVGTRVREAEERAKAAANGQTSASGRSTELVLADRHSLVLNATQQAYPKTSTRALSYRANGFGRGAAAGDRADIGTTRIGQQRPRLER